MNPRNISLILFVTLFVAFLLTPDVQAAARKRKVKQRSQLTTTVAAYENATTTVSGRNLQKRKHDDVKEAVDNVKDAISTLVPSNVSAAVDKFIDKAGKEAEKIADDVKDAADAVADGALNALGISNTTSSTTHATTKEAEAAVEAVAADEESSSSPSSSSSSTTSRPQPARKLATNESAPIEKTPDECLARPDASSCPANANIGTLFYYDTNWSVCLPIDSCNSLPNTFTDWVQCMQSCFRVPFLDQLFASLARLSNVTASS